MPFSRANHSQQPPPLWRQSQLGKRWCSAVGSFWDDLQSTPLRATAHTFLDARDWSSSGLGIGLLSGPWYAPNVTSLQCRTPHAEQPRSRSSHIYAKSLHQRVLVNKDEPWQLPEMHHQFQSQNRLFKRSRASVWRTQNHQLLCKPQCQPYSDLKWVSLSLPHSERCHDSVNPGPLGMRAEHWNDFGSLAGDSDLFVQVIAHIAAAAIPNSVLKIPKSWTDHTACQTHRRPQTTLHDVFSLQTCAQIRNGSKERISGQVCTEQTR